MPLEPYQSTHGAPFQVLLAFFVQTLRYRLHEIIMLLLLIKHLPAAKSRTNGQFWALSNSSGDKMPSVIYMECAMSSDRGMTHFSRLVRTTGPSIFKSPTFIASFTFLSLGLSISSAIKAETPFGFTSFYGSVYREPWRSGFMIHILLAIYYAYTRNLRRYLLFLR